VKGKPSDTTKECKASRKGEAVTGIVTAFCLASERDRRVSERVPSDKPLHHSTPG